MHCKSDRLSPKIKDVFIQYAEGDFSNNQCDKLTLLIDGSQKPSLKLLTLSWKSQQTKLKKGDMYSSIFTS